MGFEIKKNTAFGAPLGTEILGIKLEDINKSVSSKIEKALNDDNHLFNGLNLRDGKPIHPSLIDSL